MSTVISKNVQIGADATPSNNFTWYQPSTPDGTVRLGSGNSGSVTDVLSVSSSGLTLSGGTANGVAYLNGSKVLTTGSTLVFDGTNLALGSTSADPFGRGYGRIFGVTGSTHAAIELNGAAGYYGTLDLGVAGTRYASVVGSATELQVSTNAAIPTLFVTNNTERARITSTGEVLIGRTSVIGTNNRLAIQMAGTSASGYTGASNAALAIDAGTSTNCVLNFVGGGDMGVFRTNSSNTYDVGISFGDNSTRALLFTTANAERARIDSSGRLLVGTTSNFGGAGQFAIDQSGGGIPAIHLIGTQGVGGGAREIGATFSVVTNDTGPAYGNVAKISAAKENATQGNTAGYMAFQTTPNGGSLTERARITSTGKFGIGNSNPQYTLDVDASARIAGGAATFYMDSTYSTGQSYRWIVPDNTYGAPFGSLALYSDTQGAYRLVMSSAGNLGIGITAPSARLHVYQDSSSTSVMSGAYIQNVSSTSNTQAGIGFFAYDNYNAKIYTTRTGSSQGNIIFATNSGGGITEGFVGERARITHEGRFLINTSSTLSGSAYLQALGGPYPIWSQGSDTGYTQGAIVCASGTDSGPSGRGIGVYMWNQTSTATWYMGTAYGSGDTWFVMRKTGSGFSPDAADVALGWKMQLTSGGVAYQGNNSSSWSTTSDARIKDDVQTIENGLDVVLALRPVDFYNKVTKKREENFIAQEYEQVLAKHVTREKPIGAEQEFVTDEILRLNPNLVPYLVSAIQKLSAEIEALKATRN